MSFTMKPILYYIIFHAACGIVQQVHHLVVQMTPVRGHRPLRPRELEMGFTMKPINHLRHHEISVVA